MSLREIQQPLKDRYRQDPASALFTLRARASELPGDYMSCSVDLGRAAYQAGAHAGVGGSGASACSGDLLLASLAACAQITAQMVAEAMGLPLHGLDVTVEGDLDLRGTLGVDREAPVGFQAIRTTIEVSGDVPEADLARFQALVERYCVVLSTLRQPPQVAVTWKAGRPPSP